MLKRSLALLAVLTSTAVAADESPPQDAPAACIDPVGKNGFPAQLAKGPKVVGTYTLTVGKALVTPRLRLLATSHFMADRVGATSGEWLPGLEVALLPDVTRDGPSYRNSVDQHGYDPLRIGTYRVTVKSAAAKRVVALVEDLGCLEEYVHAPLAPNETKTFWVSTEGVRSYSFSTGHWYDQVPRMYFAVTAGLDPDVQQTPGTKTPHGWIAAQAWENQGGLPSWDDRYLDTFTPGSVMETPAHRFEIVRVELGKNTRVVDGRVVTTGGQPSISALVRVTRRAQDLDTLMRKP